LCRKTIRCRKEPEEAKITKQLRHADIVAFIDNASGEASREYDLYVEYCEKGSLFDLIEEKKWENPGQKTYVEEH
jgi:serine/threonine protein kinase